MRRFLGKFLLCPTHPQKPPIPATLHANLRINKILHNPRRYGEAEPEVEVFGQALVSQNAHASQRGKILVTINVIFVWNCPNLPKNAKYVAIYGIYDEYMVAP